MNAFDRRKRGLADLLILSTSVWFYAIPLFLGYSWNALGENYNFPNPPEGYTGRFNNQRITVEAWGASVVGVPLHAKIGSYLEHGDLPLWNPYQGLGQPFAAQGEGSPYFPFAILRGLLPYSYENFVTVFVIYLAAVFTFLFARLIGLRRGASLFAGVTFASSGAICLHLARFNIADQLCLIPVMFWATAQAIRKRSVTSYLILCGAGAIHACGGFIQIWMISSLFVVAFALAFSSFQRPQERDRKMVLGSIALGTVIAAPYLFPVVEFITFSLNKNGNYAGFAPVALANVVGFFFPVLGGGAPHGPTWLPATLNDNPQVDWQVFWDNLYGFSGITVLLLAALPICARSGSFRRRLWLFFLGAGILLLLRYVSVAPGAILNLFPIVGRQTPKHSNGLTVFCFTMASAFGVHFIGDICARRAKWLMVGILGYFACLLLTLIGRGMFLTTGKGVFALFEGSGDFWPIFLAHVGSTVLLIAVIVTSICMVLGKRDLLRRAWVVLLALALGEAIVYIPLGNKHPLFLVSRVTMCLAVVGAGWAYQFGRVRMGLSLVALVLVGYGALVNCTTIGLPERFDLEGPPGYACWLQERANHNWRSFGIRPDHSAIYGLHDISCVGPLAPMSFLEFIRLVHTPAGTNEYANTTHLMLSGPWHFDLHQYRKTKAIFDWAGIRYLVLDKGAFGPDRRLDHEDLIRDKVVRRVYEDRNAIIVESSEARPRAEFWTGLRMSASSEETLDQVKEVPETIFGAPFVCDIDARKPLSYGLDTETPNGTTPVVIDRHGPNSVMVSVDAPGPGIVVLKDAYFPGWKATVDGQPTKVFEVNGIVRGVAVEKGGWHSIEFYYSPRSFREGLWVSGIALALVTLTWGWSQYRSRQARRRETASGV